MVTLSINNDIDIIIYISFQILITIILTIISIHALIHIFCKQNENNSNNNILYHSLIQSIQITTICAILSYNLSVIFLLIWDLLIIFDDNNNYNKIIFGDIAICLDCIGRIVFQITFIFRLRVCFHGTSMQFTQCSTNTLYILTALLIIPGIGLLINKLRWYSSIIWLFLDFLISITMSWLFLKKLYKVTKNTTINTLPSNRNNINNNNNMNNMFEVIDEQKSDKPSMLSIPDDNNEENPETKNRENPVIESTIKPPSPQSQQQQQQDQQEEEEEEDNNEEEEEVEDNKEEEEEEEEENNDDDNEEKKEEAKEAEPAAIMKPPKISRPISSNLEELISRETLKEYDLITLMTKYSLLVTIAYSSSLLSIIIIFIIRKDIELIIYKNAQFVEHIFISINIFFNMLCLYLSYAFNNKYYYYCCKYGHKLCNNCCILFISRKMKNDLISQQLL